MEYLKFISAALLNVVLVIGVLLGLLKVTGMPIHIALSVMGVLVLFAYTVHQKGLENSST